MGLTVSVMGYTPRASISKLQQDALSIFKAQNLAEINFRGLLDASSF